MVDKTIIAIIKKYLKSLQERGIHSSQAVLFGSYARGQVHEWSDIDLVVIAPEFDQEYDQDLAEGLWVAAGRADSRIEPIPCGQSEWAQETGRPILEIAKREGIIIHS